MSIVFWGVPDVGEMTTSQMSSQDPIRSACVEMSPTEGQLTKEQISWVAESTAHSAR